MQWSDFERSGAVPGRPADIGAPSSLLPPATGAWRPGDPGANRHFADLGSMPLDRGGSLPVELAYETWGTLSPHRDNAVLVLHALTGDAHVEGPASPGQPTPGWWPGLIGPKAPLDTDRWFVISANMLGGCQGSTGPAALDASGREYAARFPRVTIRDQVRAQALLADRLGIERFAGVVGGSMGGMHALEWGITHPDRVARLAVLAAPPAVDALTIAQNSLQMDAIRLDVGWRDGNYYDAAPGEGPNRGLSLARRLAMLNYRAAHELGDRFGRSWQSDRDPAGGGRYAVDSYLDFHGNRFTRRFDANSYVTLVDAMNTHDIGRERGGIEEALARITAPTLVAGVDSDALFPLSGQHRIAAGLRSSVTGARALELHSPFGHDGFLLELRAVGAALRSLLSER